MAAVTRDTSFHPVSPIHTFSYVSVEDDANEIPAGTFVQRTAAGRAVVVGDSGGLGIGPVVGVNERNVPDQLGKTYSGPLERPVSKVYVGLFERPIATVNPVTDADMFQAVYAANNHDVCNDPTKPLLGVLVGINNEASTCTVLVGAGIGAALDAAKVGEILLPLPSFYETDGTPLAAFVDGASPTPGLSLNDSKAAGIRWNNDASPGQIVAPFAVPADLDPTKPATVYLTVAKVGATPADVPIFTVALFAHEVGALYDAGSDFGGETGAMADLPTKTVQELTWDIPVDSFPTTANTSGTIKLQPEAGKLSTDDLVLLSARIAYTPVI